MAEFIQSRFVGGPLHGTTAALVSADASTYWHPLPSGEVVSYGIRDGLTDEKVWAPIGMSESVFYALLTELAQSSASAIES